MSKATKVNNYKLKSVHNLIKLSTIDPTHALKQQCNLESWTHFYFLFLPISKKMKKKFILYKSR